MKSYAHAAELRLAARALKATLCVAFAASSAAATPPTKSRCDLSGHLRAEVDESCGAARLGLRVEHRARSTRRELFAEAERDEEGTPAISYAMGRIRAGRPVRRTLYELRGMFEASSPAPLGNLRSTLGFKVQIENPPRRPDDPFDRFNRKGRRALLERATLSYAGVSVGLAPSVYNLAPTLGYSTPYVSEQVVGLVAYSQQVAGLDATVAIEEQRPRRLADPAWGKYRKNTRVDLVGTLRSTQPWGRLQGSAAIHPIRTMPASGAVVDAATGWALGVGYEHWFEAGGASHGVLLTAARSNGALDYLGLGSFPADFAVAANGAVALTRGRAIVASYSRSWSSTLQSTLTASIYSTALRGGGLQWETKGTLLQVGTELALRPGFHVGLEINRHADSVRGGRDDETGKPLDHRYLSGLVYGRLRY